jgi:hypothetical protein
VRCSGIEPVRAAHQHAGTKRCVELVAREGDVVDVVRGDVDPPVWGQLGRIHCDPCPVLVRQRGKGTDGKDFARDVGSSGHGEQADAALPQFRTDGVNGFRNGVRCHDAAVGDTLPRQEVGVVLNVEVQDVAVGPSVGDGQAARQQVEGVSGVPGKDHRIVRAAAHEVADDGAGVLIDRGADLGGVAGTAVDAGVEGQDLVEVGLHHREGGGRCAIVQVGVPDVAAVDQRGLDFGAADCC